ncbi:MAG: PQQ-like beta-propeller repeat protein [Planctomycetes bacterium]|nr:PQQ-like beta-propeller repeat protein [Planctomycetota bacterium]
MGESRSAVRACLSLFCAIATSRRLRTCGRFVVALAWLCPLAQSADWPEFGGNADRTDVTAETLQLPLSLAWSFQANHPPSPAFKGLTRLPTTAAAIAYDHAFHPVVADGRLYFGSSTEEAVFCLNTRTGEMEWVFWTEGAVRLAPTVWKGKALFGSDDGHVYCLDAKTGEPAWKFQAAPG